MQHILVACEIKHMPLVWSVQTYLFISINIYNTNLEYLSSSCIGICASA